jgi:hypothetical protein
MYLKVFNTLNHGDDSLFVVPHLPLAGALYYHVKMPDPLIAAAFLLCS